MIVFLYVGMLKRLWNPSSATLANRRTSNKASKDSLRNKKRVTRLVLVVIVVFSVCWAPIQFVLLFKAIGLYQTSTLPAVIFQIFSHVLAYLNRQVLLIIFFTFIIYNKTTNPKTFPLATPDIKSESKFFLEHILKFGLY